MCCLFTWLGRRGQSHSDFLCGYFLRKSGFESFTTSSYLLVFTCEPWSWVRVSSTTVKKIHYPQGVLNFFLAGAKGLEPLLFWTKTSCLTNLATPHRHWITSLHSFASAVLWLTRRASLSFLFPTKSSLPSLVNNHDALDFAGAPLIFWGTENSWRILKPSVPKSSFIFEKNRYRESANFYLPNVYFARERRR